MVLTSLIVLNCIILTQQLKLTVQFKYKRFIDYDLNKETNTSSLLDIIEFKHKKSLIECLVKCNLNIYCTHVSTVFNSNTYKCSLFNASDYIVLKSSVGSISYVHKDKQSSILYYPKSFKLSGHNGAVTSLAHVESELLISGSTDGFIRIWDIKYRSLLKLIKAHSLTINSLIVLNNVYLISGSDDKTIKKWNVSTLSLNNNLTFSCIVKSLAVFQNDLLIIGFQLPCVDILIINTTDMSNKTILIGHVNTVMNLLVLPNEDLISASIAGYLVYWNMTSNGSKKIESVQAHSMYVYSLILFGNDKFVSSSNDGLIRIWKFSIFNEFLNIARLNISSGIRSLAVLANGDLVSGSEDGKIRIWDVENKKVKMILNEHLNTVQSLLTLSNGYLVTGSNTNIIVYYI